MKNRIKFRTVLIIVVSYLYISLMVIGAGIGSFLVFVIYCAAAIFVGRLLLMQDIAIAERNELTFRKTKPLRGYGEYLINFQHVFHYEHDIFPSIIKEVNTRTTMGGILPILQTKAYTDVDNNLKSSDTRNFYLASSEANLRGTEVSLAIHLRRRGNAHSIEWWVLMRGFIDKDKMLSILALAPISLPFWLWSKHKQELDLASAVRNVYNSFYNSLDIVADARGLHTFVIDTVVDTLDEHGIDTSDLKTQRAQIMNINISGGRASFGNVIQAVKHARTTQAGVKA